MPLEDLLTFLRARPFVPFRIHLLDGTSHEVRHCELVLPQARSFLLGINADADAPYAEQGRVMTVSLLAVSRLEPLPHLVKSSGNGQVG